MATNAGKLASKDDAPVVVYPNTVARVFPAGDNFVLPPKTGRLEPICTCRRSLIVDPELRQKLYDKLPDKDGFTVDDGPLRKPDDPENAAFLGAVNRGQMPAELIGEDGVAEGDVHIVDKSGEAYKPPPVTLKPFQGEGRSMRDDAPCVCGIPYCRRSGDSGGEPFVLLFDAITFGPSAG